MHQVQCPTCLTWVPSAGPDGFFPHVLHEHPESPLAVQVDGLLLRGIFEDGLSPGRPTP